MNHIVKEGSGINHFFAFEYLNGMLTPGYKIGNYEIMSILGKGGMATVYLAHDEKFNARVALKVLNRELVFNENIRKRFLSEARNMFRMSHPNIVRVSDLIDDGERVAFVMDFIEGETLKEYLERRGRLSNEETKRIFSQMLDAVGYVHDQNLIHRDIKPSNFMLDRRGVVKLMDFGIAKNTDSNSFEYTRTGTGVQMGTPMYMSPEQITETKSVTPQSDLYSMGVVLWQMVSGYKPYDSSTMSDFQLKNKIVHDSLPMLNNAWDFLIQKATNKDINSRFISAKEFSENMAFTIRDDVRNTVDQTVLEYQDRADSNKFQIDEQLAKKQKDGVIYYPEYGLTSESYEDIENRLKLETEEDRDNRYKREKNRAFELMVLENQSDVSTVKILVSEGVWVYDAVRLCSDDGINDLKDVTWFYMIDKGYSSNQMVKLLVNDLGLSKKSANYLINLVEFTVAEKKQINRFFYFHFLLWIFSGGFFLIGAFHSKLHIFPFYYSHKIARFLLESWLVGTCCSLLYFILRFYIRVYPLANRNEIDRQIRKAGVYASIIFGLLIGGCCMVLLVGFYVIDHPKDFGIFRK